MPSKKPPNAPIEKRNLWFCKCPKPHPEDAPMCGWCGTKKPKEVCQS